MKKLLIPIAMAAVTWLSACSNEPAPAAEKKETAPPPQKEVIVVKPEPVVVEKKASPEKQTEVSLDKNGVKVQTKKVKVVLGKDSQ